jgi:hypothetical protein
MAGNDPNNPDEPEVPVVEEAPKSLREIAEESWNEIEDEADAAEGSGQEGRERDSFGRFVAKKPNEPGEQSLTDPAPRPVSETQRPQVDPAPPGSSNQPPEHWSAEDKAEFLRLPPQGQAFLLRRSSEMDADYTRKSQANAGAVNFATALAPVFNDDVVRASLQREGVDPVHAIHEWANLHRRAVSPNAQERYDLLVDLSQRMGFDPARVFAAQTRQPEPQLSEADQKDPAIRYFVDHLGRTASELAELKAALQGIRQEEASRREEEGLRTTRWGIDSFADAKDQQGNPLHPHFDAVLPQIIDLFKADPSRDLKEAYETALWMAPSIRNSMLQTERTRAQGQNSLERARVAARGNTRGLTSPVSKPNSRATGNGTLRDTLEASADEVGF